MGHCILSIIESVTLSIIEKLIFPVLLSALNFSRSSHLFAASGRRQVALTGPHPLPWEPLSPPGPSGAV